MDVQVIFAINVVSSFVSSAAVWGAADLLFAFYQGPHARIRPEMLGAAFYLPTAIVPPLLVTHFLIFGLLIRRTGS